MKAEACELVLQGKLGPATAMASGAMEVQGMEHLPLFGVLFPNPDPDQQIAPMMAGAMG